MSLQREIDLAEAEAIIGRVFVNLLMAVPPTADARKGAVLRRSIGDFQAAPWALVANGTFSTELLNCFKAAADAGLKLNMMRKLIDDLAAEKAKGVPAIVVVIVSLVYALAQEARLLIAITYRSRDEVDEIIAWLKKQFDFVKELAADRMDNDSYLKVTNLAASVIHFLVETARPLPRVVNFRLRPMPSLTLANRIYGDASRAEELAAENRIVHPAFMLPEIRALSS